MADKNLIGVGAANAVLVGGTDIGYTLGGVEVSVSQTTFDIEADQSNSALQITLLEKEYTVKTPLAESSIDNIATFFTAVKGTNVAGTTKLILDSDDFAAVTTLEFNTNLVGASKVLRFYYHEAQVQSVDPVTINKGQQSVWSVTWRCFPKTGSTQVGYVYLQTT